MFKRRRFPVEIILLCVRWYCKYGISYRDIVEMMRERGVEVDPSTIMRWVHRYAPELEKRVRWYQGYRATSWRVDETYVKVGGRWKYLFRAVDKHGRLIDFMLARSPHTRAACRFLGKALTTMRHWPPSSITTDQLGSYPKAILGLQQEGKLSADTKHRTCKYLNNIIEADHGALKRVIRPTRGFQTMKTAAATIKGFEVMRMIRRGHCLTCKPHVKDEIRFVNKLFDTFPVASRERKVARQTAARQVNATEPYCPTSLANLDVFFSKGHQFCSTKSASEQDRDHSHVTGASEALAIRSLKKHASLVAGEPVTGPRA